MDKPRLSWRRVDPERRFLLPAGPATCPNTWIAAALGLVFSVVFYVILSFFRTSYIYEMFFYRSFVPYVIVFLGGWSVAMLLLKWLKLRAQSCALSCPILVEGSDMVISPDTVDDVLGNIYDMCDEPQRFVLFNRVIRALGNLKNLGRVTDVDELLRSQADNDYNMMISSYTLLRGFIWAIPILGFIGTVLGLSKAVAGFGTVLGARGDASELVNELQGVTGGLAVAFETTLIALLVALGLQLWTSFLRHAEENFLARCDDYCHRHVVSHLRMLPFNNEP